MRLLFESTSEAELAAARLCLKERGIPVFISSARTYHTFTGGKRGLWVCLEQHFEDAQAVLRDPSHRVARPIDVDDFYRALEEVGRQPLSAMGINPTTLLNIVVVAAMLAGLGVLVWAIYA
jgi:hypothetical protein